MAEFTFLLKYSLSEHDRDVDDLVERLGAAGCTDALVGSGITGRLGLEFTREADSADEAISSALKDVGMAIPSATLVEASPDLVGLTDVADLVDVSRQNMRKLMVNNDDFPAPVHEGSASLWHLIDILRWLDNRKTYSIDRTLMEIARVTLKTNLERDAKRYATIDRETPALKFG